MRFFCLHVAVWLIHHKVMLPPPQFTPTPAVSRDQSKCASRKRSSTSAGAGDEAQPSKRSRLTPGQRQRRRVSDVLQRASAGVLRLQGPTLGSNTGRATRQQRRNLRRARADRVRQHKVQWAGVLPPLRIKRRARMLEAPKERVDSRHDGRHSEDTWTECEHEQISATLESLTQTVMTLTAIADRCRCTAVKRSSTHGWGLFAGEDEISPGDVVAILSWGPVSTTRLPKCTQVRGGYQQYSTSPKGDTRYRGGCANEPGPAQTQNCAILQIDVKAGRLRKGHTRCTVLVAARRIAPGGEVLVKYGKTLMGEDGWSHRQEEED
jgi:hypothetical protein